MTIILRYYLFFLILGALASIPFSQAMAACTPGLPCVTNATPNTPMDNTDGPNAPGSPNVNKSASNTCDADFMNQIYSRAFIEAEREVVLSQVAIRKPDSVLEYTCFDQLASLVATKAAPLFSESNEWQNVTVDISAGALSASTILSVPPVIGRLGDTLENLVLTALVGSGGAYIDENFAHDFLGGAAIGLDGDISDTIPVNYTCDWMATLYDFVHCVDFMSDDQFFSFSQLAALDPRALPAMCNPPDTTIENNIIDLSQNNAFLYVNYDEKDISLYDGGLNKTYKDRRDPLSCSEPILTGLTYTLETSVVDPLGNVITAGSSTFYDEKICSNPSCHYDKATNNCVQ